jgi:hypothetical protein
MATKRWQMAALTLAGWYLMVPATELGFGGI